MLVLSLPPSCRPNKKRKCYRGGTFFGGLVDDSRTTDGLSGREQHVVQRVSCLLVHLRENMGVGVQRYADVSVAQAVLYDLSVDACGDHRRGIAVTKIV